MIDNRLPDSGGKPLPCPKPRRPERGLGSLRRRPGPGEQVRWSPFATMASGPEVSSLNNLKDMRFRTRDAGKPTPADDHNQNMPTPRPREREAWHYNLSLTSSKHSRSCRARYRQALSRFGLAHVPSPNEVSVMMGTACAIASARPVVQFGR